MMNQRLTFGNKDVDWSESIALLTMQVLLMKKYVSGYSGPGINTG